MLINNVLDIWATIDPRRIINKIKLHIFVHLEENIRRFGPAILYSTEIFECWNAIFRLCSVLSNHLGPSHDIAVTMADMERFKHQVSGGYWKSKSGQYVQAGRKVRSFMLENQQLQRRLGWVDSSQLIVGQSVTRLKVWNLTTFDVTGRVRETPTPPKATTVTVAGSFGLAMDS